MKKILNNKFLISFILIFLTLFSILIPTISVSAEESVPVVPNEADCIFYCGVEKSEDETNGKIMRCYFAFVKSSLSNNFDYGCIVFPQDYFQYITTDNYIDDLTNADVSYSICNFTYSDLVDGKGSFFDTYTYRKLLFGSFCGTIATIKESNVNRVFCFIPYAKDLSTNEYIFSHSKYFCCYNEEIQNIIEQGDLDDYFCSKAYYDDSVANMEDLINYLNHRLDVVVAKNLQLKQENETLKNQTNTGSVGKNQTNTGSVWKTVGITFGCSLVVFFIVLLSIKIGKDRKKNKK